MSLTTAYGTPTNVTDTITVTADVACVPTTVLAAGNAVLVSVLSNGVYFSMHDSGATPDQDDAALNAGDELLFSPASWLRFRRQSTDSCVKFQAFQA